MVSEFYRRHSLLLLLTLLCAMPVLTLLGEMVPSNNDVETWLPHESRSRADYDSFCRAFGADETILIAFERPFPDSDRIAAFSRRLSGLDGIASCRTRQDIIDAMVQNGVQQEIAEDRLIHFLATPNHALETMLVSINDRGIAQRQKTVEAIRAQLEYCGMANAVVAGGPIVSDQLDRLGNRKEALTLFGCTVLICLLLLQINVGCWKTSGALMLANLLCIEMTLATLLVLGMEMNFIMSSLPVMVMVFTTAASIHFIGHYRHALPDRNACSRAMAVVIRPSAFATLTTIIGLISLAISNVGPVPAFGQAAAIGTFYSFVIGVLVTPAVLTALKYRPAAHQRNVNPVERIGMFVINRPWRVVISGVVVTAVCAAGTLQLRSLISPLDFLPNNDTVLRDTLLIQETLTSPTSIEAIVDFSESGNSFIERLRRVRDIEGVLAESSNVCHVLSLADFFPEEISEDTLSLTQLATSSQSDDVRSLMADGSRLWRISIRLHDDDPAAVRETVLQLQDRCAHLPVTLTGLAPLLEEAQTQIFEGFWRSFLSAFVLITVIMMAALRSVRAGLVAMIPNLTPILLVFGILGWANYPIDIGIMMTASIALGLAVDGTFHFLFCYRDSHDELRCRYRSVRTALFRTGMPIISSAVISGCGLLALGLSPFKPTMRFGVLMFLLLMAAIVGDLLLLPAFLACGAKRKRRSAKERVTVIAPQRAAA